MKRMDHSSAVFSRALQAEGHHTFAPTERRTLMSSKTKQQYLTSENLNMLKSVLIKSGYWCDMRPMPRDFDVAAKLIIQLFQRGCTEAGSLEDQLIQCM